MQYIGSIIWFYCDNIVQSRPSNLKADIDL